MQSVSDPCACPYETISPTQRWVDAVANVADDRINPHTAARFHLDRATKVASAGSCFAQRISESLVERGFNYLVVEPGPRWLPAEQRRSYSYGVYSARYGNVYTPLQLVQLVQRALGTFVPLEPAWPGPGGRWFDPFRPRIQPNGFSSEQELLADRTHHLLAVKSLLESLDVFIFTLGMTEAWRTRRDGAVFPICPGCVAGRFTPDAYEFHNFSVQEVIDHLDQFFHLLAGVNPRAKVILTVSPVPLTATMTGNHVLQATVYSKSVLRVAAEEIARRRPNADYFASYEIAVATRNTHRYYAPDKRSVTPAGVAHVMDAFFQTFVTEGRPAVALPTAPAPHHGPKDDLVCDELAMFEALGNRRKEAS